MASIRTALIALGVKGRATAEEITAGRYKVTVNGEYVGVFDINRNTFVD